METTPDQLTDEHIWPQSLGGSLMEGELRSRRVCRSCNNKCGLFIDGAVAKSFFTKHAMFHEALEYCDVSTGRAMLPLIYMGPLKTVDPSTFGDYDTCELWLSPCRSRVLHFHSNRTDKFRTQAGGNPIDKRKKPGMAIFCPASQSMTWLGIGLRSFREQFRKATRYLAFMRLVNEAQHQHFGDELPADLDAALRQVSGSGGLDNIRVELEFDFLAEDRFLSKIALGVGHSVLGDGYLRTTMAKHHRDILHERSLEARERLPRLSSWQFTRSSEADAMWSIIGWRGGIALYIAPAPIGLAMFASVFGSQAMIWVSNDRELLAHANVGSGVVHVVIPQIKRYSGPIAWDDYLSHNLGGPQVPVLVELESLRADPANRPSLDERSDEIQDLGPPSERPPP